MVLWYDYNSTLVSPAIIEGNGVLALGNKGELIFDNPIAKNGYLYYFEFNDSTNRANVMVGSVDYKRSNVNSASDVMGVLIDTINMTCSIKCNNLVVASGSIAVGDKIKLYSTSTSIFPKINPQFNIANTVYGSGYTKLFHEYLYKSLIYGNGSYMKYLASSWQIVTLTTPTELDYLNGNTLSEIALIPESAWKQLSGTVELCYFTDNNSKTEVQFNIETAPFTLTDEFKDKEIKIIEYTDNPFRLESKVETDVKPYTIYDEFDDTMEVLYYTEDKNRTTANLEITANYSPLDELDDFEVVTWSNTIDEVKQENIPKLTSDIITDGKIYETPLNLENVVKIQ